jgi:hypothetical protein
LGMVSFFFLQRCKADYLHKVPRLRMCGAYFVMHLF